MRGFVRGAAVALVIGLGLSGPAVADPVNCGQTPRLVSGLYSAFRCTPGRAFPRICTYLEGLQSQVDDCCGSVSPVGSGKACLCNALVPIQIRYGFVRVCSRAG